MQARSADAAVGGSGPLREVLRRYRDGVSVPVLAKEFGVPFDWVARRVIAAGVRRNRSPRPNRQDPVELESDEWLAARLASGAGVSDISWHLGVSRSAVRRALRRYVAHRAPDTDHVGPSDPELRFRVATERVDRATRLLEHARRMQASAVVELQHAGLTNAVIADRLGVDDHVVDVLAAGNVDTSSA